MTPTPTATPTATPTVTPTPDRTPVQVKNVIIPIKLSPAYLDAKTIIKTADNNFLSIGTTNNCPAFWKFSLLHELLWNKWYGSSGMGNNYKYFDTAWEESDGSLIGLGVESKSYSSQYPEYKNFLLIKTDSNGEKLTEMTLGGEGDDLPAGSVKNADGGVIIAGSTTSRIGDISSNNGMYDLWITRLDADYNIVWSKTLGGKSNDKVHDILAVGNDEYLILAQTRSQSGDVTQNAGMIDTWLIKINGAGTIIWEKTYGGNKDDIPADICQTSDNGYIFTGTTYSTDGKTGNNQGNGDFWLVKVDNSGLIEWQQNYGGSSLDFAKKVVAVPDGTYYLVGETESNDGQIAGYYDYKDIWLLKLDTIGNPLWQRCFGGMRSEYVSSLYLDDDNILMMSGRTASFDGDFEYKSNMSWEYRNFLYKISENPVTPTPVPKNIAPGKTATASSQWPWDPPRLAVDGNMNTAWETDKNSLTTEWFELDLGTRQHIDQLQLHWQDDENPTSYTIYYTDETNNWIELQTITKWNSSPDLIKFTPGITNKIKLDMVKSNGPGVNLIILKEFQVLQFQE